jgi:hypothetical protein
MQQTDLQRIVDKINTGAFADDLLGLCGKRSDLRAQAEKLTQYSDWASLIISGKKHW